MLRILLLEEQQSEIRLIESILNDARLDYDVKYSKSENDFIKNVNNFNPDVIISGSHLSKYSINEALQYLFLQNKLIPFILISNNLPDELAREYLKKGVDDYVNKFNLLSLPTLITKAIENKKIFRLNSLAGQRVKSKEQKFNQYFENNNDLIIEFGVKTEILSINPATEKSIGIKLKLEKKIKLQELVFPEDLKRFKELHSSAFRGHKKDIVVRLQWKKNQVTLNGRLLPVYNGDNEISSVMLIGSDITERLNKEQELLVTKSSYDALFEAINDAVCIFDSDLKLTSFNSYMSDLIFRAFKIKLKNEMTVEEFLPHPLLYNKWKERFNKVLAGETITVEDSVEINGEVIYSYISCYPYKVNDNQCNILFISKNITSFKRAEEELKKNEYEFRLLSENAPVGIFKTDRNGQCEYVNKKWCEMSGISPENSKGEGWLNSIHPEDKDNVLSAWKDTINKDNQFNLQYRIVNQKTGKVFWIECSAVSIKKPATGIVNGYIGTITDISYLIYSQKAEEERKLLLKTIEETTNIGFWIVDRNNNNKSVWSDGVYTILEIDPIKGIPDQDDYLSLVHNDDRDELLLKLQGLFKYGLSFNFEFRLVFKNGKQKKILGMGNAVKNKDGRVEKLIGTIKDITEIYQQKEKIEENSFLMQQAFNLAKIGSWEVDVETMNGFWSNEMRLILGIDEDSDKTQFEKFIECVLPEDRKALIDFQQKQIDDGKTGSHQFRIIKDGKIHTLVSLSHTILNSSGKTEKLLGITMDITEQVYEKSKNHESEKFMELIFYNSPDAIYIEDQEGFILKANEKAAEVQGMNLSELIGKNIIDLTPIEKRNEVISNHAKFFSEEINVLNSYTVSSDGKKIPIQIRSKKIEYLGKQVVVLCVRETF